MANLRDGSFSSGSGFMDCPIRGLSVDLGGMLFTWTAVERSCTQVVGLYLTAQPLHFVSGVMLVV